MTVKSLADLTQDIYSVLSNGGFDQANPVHQEAIETAVSTFRKNLIALASEKQSRGDFRLRPSVLGMPLRKMWYFANFLKHSDSVPKPEDYMKFFYGHMVESISLFLFKVAGHKVEYEQKDISVEGMAGNTDCVIDGVPVDVKSASRFAFQKFLDNTLRNDNFGYYAQLSSYRSGLIEANLPIDKSRVALFAVNKEDGRMHVHEVPVTDLPSTKKMLREARAVIEKTEPPEERCYPDEPHNKSGNMKVHSNCMWCPAFKECRKNDNLRGFKYKTGTVWLTKVEKEPKDGVPEIKLDQ